MESEGRLLDDYEMIIGLEVHVALKTNSKIFCGCATEFEAVPNTQVCPICLGLPGALPVLNQRAVELAMTAGAALNCQIMEYSRFDRKQYFYPDLPKAYQITQQEFPICQGGWLKIPTATGEKRVGVNRIHLEEEAGRSHYSGAGLIGSEYSLFDYNRGGIPLIEIVTEPDLRSPEEARAFLEKLKVILQYIEVSDCKMEEGAFRCDANISLRPYGKEWYGKRAELKNINSFRALQEALEYEANRQKTLMKSGKALAIEESRAWDEVQRVTVFMREKEKAQDYRYFPDPDLAPVVVDEGWARSIREGLPELPEAKRDRYLLSFGLPEYDANLLSATRLVAEFFEAVVAFYGGEAKTVANWIIGEVAKLLNKEKAPIEEVRFGPKELACLLDLIDKGALSSTLAKSVLEEMFYTGKNPQQIIEETGLTQITDTGQIRAVVLQIIEKNTQSVTDYLSGKEKALGFLVGQVMKETRGQANPGEVNVLLREELERKRV